MGAFGCCTSREANLAFPVADGPIVSGGIDGEFSVGELSLPWEVPDRISWEDLEIKFEKILARQDRIKQSRE